MSWTALTTQPQCENCGTVMRELFSSLYCPAECSEIEKYTAYINERDVKILASKNWVYTTNYYPALEPTGTRQIKVVFSYTGTIEREQNFNADYACQDGTLTIHDCDHPAWMNRK